MGLTVSDVREMFDGKISVRAAKKLVEIERQYKKLGTKQKYLFWKQEERKAKEQLNNSSTQ